ncbi:hypothetical protein [Microbacterium yannicii]|uniref:hypothetical protein n=1 Tax=Microbacterium yannicii TaxID=671622 RepID=UPI00030FBD4F|nr:hypothetical protein [Microbacterium yannicii]
MANTRTSNAIGRALAAVFAGMLLVRRPRPIHPHGVELEGEISWLSRSQSGIGWIDDPAPEPERVVARASRSIGLPPPLPDIVGLALRIESRGQVADLELASTGAGVPGRFGLLLHRSPSRAHLGTLLPYVGDRGAMLIAARTISPHDLPTALPDLATRLRTDAWHLRLYAARLRGPWHPFADLELRATPGRADSPLRFDAGRRLLPGARLPEWVRAVRQPSYDRVQRSSRR